MEEAELASASCDVVVPVSHGHRGANGAANTAIKCGKHDICETNPLHDYVPNHTMCKLEPVDVHMHVLVPNEVPINDGK